MNLAQFGPMSPTQTQTGGVVGIYPNKLRAKATRSGDARKPKITSTIIVLTMLSQVVL